MKEKLKQFIKENYVKEKELFFGSMRKAVYYDYECAGNIDEYINDNKDESKFQTLLFKYIDERKLKDSDVYNKVNIDRRLFSKIRSDKNYHPSFGTVTLLALALNLSTKKFEQLLNSAFYSLPTNTYFGITLKYCFDNKLYDVFYVNNLIYTLTDKEIKDL